VFVCVIGQEKTRLKRVSMRAGWLDQKAKRRDWRRKFLGHENGDEGQQENKNRASDRNNDWNVFHDTFNGIVGCV